jgi:hypothetical protein
MLGNKLAMYFENAFNIKFGHFPPMDFDTYVKKKLQLNIPMLLHY